MSLVPVYKVERYIKVVVKNKIVEISIRNWVSDTKVVLTEVLLGQIKDTKDTVCGAGIDIMVAARGLNKEVIVWPILVVLVTIRESTKNIWPV